MNCQVCNEREARIQVTELTVVEGQPDNVPVPEQAATQRSLCMECATDGQLPVSVVKKAPLDIWKLLQQTAEKHRRDTQVECPDCGMTLGEFRAKGRLGCPRDYEIFREHLDPLLKRIHNADGHAGRLPGVVPEDAGLQGLALPIPSQDALPDALPMEPLPEGSANPPEPSPQAKLSAELEAAIASEDYERAAELRDQLSELDS